MAKIAGLPRTSKLVTKDAKIDEDWDQYLQRWLLALNSTTQQFAVATDTNAAATVATTDFPTTAELPGGLYQVTYALWLTQAATVSSSLTFTVTWTNNSQTLSQSGAALTSNTLTSQQNGVITFHIDPSTMVSYTLTYASNGGTPMHYSYDVRLSAVPGTTP